MNKLAKIFVLLNLAMTWVSSCTDKDNESPYSEILSSPPFDKISDSIREEPGNDVLYFRRAVLLNTNNLPEPALADFKKAWSLKKEEKYAFGLGNLWLDKKPDSAAGFLKEALKELPNSVLLQLTLARSLAARNQTGEALQICNTILAQNPGRADVLKLKAELVAKKGNPAEVIAILEEAYRLTPFDIDLNYELAFKYAENKNAKVMALCDSLIKIDTLNLHAEPYYYKGIYFSNINDKTKALALFDEAIRHDYNYLNAYIEKGRILLEQKKPSAAYAVFQLANTISPKFPDAYFWMGRSQEAMGQLDEARLNYQKAWGLDNSFTEAKEAAEKLGK